MKPILYLLLGSFMALNLASCASDQLEDENVTIVSLEKAPAAKVIEVEILELINQHRIGMDLQPLHNLNVIKSVAYTHTEYMVSVNQVSHDNFFQRRNSLVQSTSASKVSENVAYAYSSAASVVKAWLNSPSHRATIEGDFTDFDISAEKNSEGKWYFTNIFIKR